MNERYCTSSDLINVFANIYYLEKDRSFYLKGTGQEYFNVKNLNSQDLLNEDIN